MSSRWYVYIILLSIISILSYSADQQSVVAPGVEVVTLAGDFSFTEGPAADSDGNIFFTDIPNNRILKWSLEGELSTFLENSEGTNGLYFNKDGNLVGCQMQGRKLVSIDKKANVTALAETYNGKKFNSLNDLWIAPNGGIYFTDPSFGSGDMEMEGQFVYYLPPGSKKVIRVVDDSQGPNGVVGTPDGKQLYVTDMRLKQTFVYNINEDGTLSDKKVFAGQGGDGMTIDNRGNVYLAAGAVVVFNSKGEQIETIKVPESPSNMCFGGSGNSTLYITARTSLYAVKMAVKGATPEQKATISELGFEVDTIKTNGGDLKITFVGHGTLMFEFADKIIHVDPVGREADYTKMPKADLILITHEHGDHLDPKAIDIIKKDGTEMILTQVCSEKVSGGQVMKNGDTKTVMGLKIEAVPAYNLEQSFHPKGRGNGYVITFGDKRVYVAGDTDNIPEMKELKDIEIAFLPMNRPYTMTPEMVADAVEMIKPKILYPYHYSQTDTSIIVELLKDSETEVRIRQMQ